MEGFIVFAILISLSDDNEGQCGCLASQMAIVVKIILVNTPAYTVFTEVQGCIWLLFWGFFVIFGNFSNDIWLWASAGASNPGSKYGRCVHEWPKWFSRSFSSGLAYLPYFIWFFFRIYSIIMKISRIKATYYIPLHIIHKSKCKNIA